MNSFLNCMFIFIFVYPLIFYQSYAVETNKLLIVTVATHETDGYNRFRHSLDVFGHKDVLVLGMHEEWKGGDLRVSAGGGFKINLLKQALEKCKDNQDLILLFTDSYDVVFAADKEEIISKFKRFNARIVFSSEQSLWPDRTLKDKYPEVSNGNRYLCSGGIIAYADVFWKVINQWPLEDLDDDQLYYTKIYIDSTLRTQLNATLDHRSDIFQNINFARDELEMEEGPTHTFIKNTKYSTIPSILHGNGPSKLHLDHFSNYVPDGWHSDYGCRYCATGLLELDENSLPLVQLAVFVLDESPFFAEFLDRIFALDYPRSNIHLFVHLQDEKSERIFSNFLLRHRSDYASVHVIAPHDFTDQSTARNSAVDLCLEAKCAYQLSIDSNVQISKPDLLKSLIRKNKQMVAPLVKREGKLWSNFWGAINNDGYYARSDDYLDIVNDKKIGIWNVPFVNAIYLTKASALRQLLDSGLQPYTYDQLDTDMAYCNHLRDKGIFMFVTNEEASGRLLEVDNVKKGQIHPDLWQIIDNPTDWEEKFLHPGFWNASLDGVEVEQPCPDAYLFPLFTPSAADAVVEVMEDYGQWSSGGNKDNRLAGGYENVPTVDIHMKQIEYEKEWLHLLATYPTKIVEKVYPGFYTKAHSIMMFVVRYKPSEQSFLRPHHDSSTWTMNVALNSHGTDYEGGGCRFLRYNCSVTNIPKGYALIHPGRLTHYHEGLQTTKGTRYIAVSFVDP